MRKSGGGRAGNYWGRYKIRFHPIQKDFEPRRRSIRHLAITIVALLPSVSSQSADHHVKHGDLPQAALDRAAPGDRLVFLPGLNHRLLGKHRSLLYVNKSVEIELRAGATSKFADGETTQEKIPEITTDHGAQEKLDDQVVGHEYNLSLVDNGQRMCPT